MRISDWSSDVCSSDLDNPQEHSQRQRRNKAARDLAGNYAFGLFLDHVDHHFDKGLEAARNARIGQLCSAPHQENDHKTCKDGPERSEEHTSELQSLMRISYAVFCLKQKKKTTYHHINNSITSKYRYNMIK